MKVIDRSPEIGHAYQVALIRKPMSQKKVRCFGNRFCVRTRRLEERDSTVGMLLDDNKVGELPLAHCLFGQLDRRRVAAELIDQYGKSLERKALRAESSRRWSDPGTFLQYRCQQLV